jgi:hypothetical protein
MPGKRPNLFLVGAMKAGTTSLASYLEQHPEVDFCVPKEPNFFGGGPPWSSPSKLSPAEYARLFTEHRGRWSGEASVQYLSSPTAPSEVHRHDPDARIVAILRNPIDRAYSHHQHNAKTFEHRTFAQAVEDELAGIGRDRFLYDWGYLELGAYAAAVERWLRCFGDARVQLLTTESLDRSPERMCGEVFSFLDVDPGQPIDARRRLNPSGRLRFGGLRRYLTTHTALRVTARALLSQRTRSRLVLRLDELLVVKPVTPPIDPPLRARLAGHLHRDVERLRSLTELDLSAWKDWP